MPTSGIAGEGCPRCGGATPLGARFCMHCGAPLARRCGGCGAALPAEAHFCPSCGRAVGDAPASLPARSPRDYTPRHLADRILQSRSALEGERKQVTVLFADLKSSMELAERLDAEEWHRILDRFFTTPWMQKSYYQQLPLAPLGPEAARQLLCELLGRDASLELVERGDLEGSPGALRLTRPVDLFRIPPTVQALLAARIDRLPEREKHVLQTAAVIGREFALPILEAVAELPERELRESLGRLRSAELLYEESLYPAAVYAFKHPLTQEVALRSQLQERRRWIHAAVARTIEALQPEKLDERAALLAHHWEEAGDGAQALRWHHRAALRSVHDPEALHHWRRVAALLGPRPASAEEKRLALRARGRILSHGTRVGLESAEIDSLFDEGRELGAEVDDLALRADLLRSYVGARWALGAGPRDPALLEEAERLAERIEAPGLYASVVYAVGLGLLSSGRPREGLAAIERGLARSTDRDRIRVTLLPARARILVDQGRFHEAAADLEESLDLGRRSGTVIHLLAIRMSRAVLEHLRGNYEAASREIAATLELGEKAGAHFYRVQAYALLAEVHLRLGRFDEAAEAAETSLEIAKRTKAYLGHEARAAIVLVEAQLGKGDLARARDGAEELAKRSEGGVGTSRIRILVTLARVLRACAALDSASRIESCLEESLRILEQTGSRFWEPHVRIERAELARALGDAATWEREIREAQRLFVEMGATGHAERLARELGP